MVRPEKRTSTPHNVSYDLCLHHRACLTHALTPCRSTHTPTHHVVQSIKEQHAVGGAGAVVIAPEHPHGQAQANVAQQRPVATRQLLVLHLLLVAKQVIATLTWAYSSTALSKPANSTHWGMLVKESDRERALACVLSYAPYY